MVDFRKAEYDLAKQYSDVHEAQAVIADYERGSRAESDARPDGESANSNTPTLTELQNQINDIESGQLAPPKQEFTVTTQDGDGNVVHTQVEGEPLVVRDMPAFITKTQEGKYRVFEASTGVEITQKAYKTRKGAERAASQEIYQLTKNGKTAEETAAELQERFDVVNKVEIKSADKRLREIVERQPRENMKGEVTEPNPNQAENTERANQVEQTKSTPEQSKEFKNVPLREDHLYTQGNLYKQTKPGSLDDWTKPFRDGMYEYRLHTKRSKDGQTFNSFERRYLGDDGPREWEPASRAAYTWRTQKKKMGRANRNALTANDTITDR